MRGDKERNAAVQKLVEKMQANDEKSESTDGDGPSAAEFAQHLKDTRH